MSKPIQFGIGFLAGRPNVCKIINRYYKDIIEQGEKYGKDVKFTIFILYDFFFLRFNSFLLFFKFLRLLYITSYTFNYFLSFNLFASISNLSKSETIF